ncbi:hypothetical protein ANCCAN_00120 [Ancylostoma caninum]|uniref:Uncharacterized protein n=1 Tax=Ancylostoma caninum TaxID=29170 RepID=A0A368HAR4_ANCCA|nr:hypothetical protein ANCCAN_00120 [Ancylostoma caninum]
MLPIANLLMPPILLPSPANRANHSGLLPLQQRAAIADVQAQDVNLHQHGSNTPAAENSRPAQLSEIELERSRAISEVSDGEPSAAQDNDDFLEPVDFLLEHKFSRCPCSCCRVLKSTYNAMKPIAKLIMRNSRRFFKVQYCIEINDILFHFS